MDILRTATVWVAAFVLGLFLAALIMSVSGIAVMAVPVRVRLALTGAIAPRGRA